jgi:hypothetical protein
MLVAEAALPEMETAQIALDRDDDPIWIEVTLLGSAPSELGTYMVRIKFHAPCPDQVLAQAIRGDRNSW